MTKSCRIFLFNLHNNGHQLMLSQLVLCSISHVSPSTLVSLITKLSIISGSILQWKKKLVRYHCSTTQFDMLYAFPVEDHMVNPGICCRNNEQFTFLWFAKTRCRLDMPIHEYSIQEAVFKFAEAGFKLFVSWSLVNPIQSCSKSG